MVRSQHHSLYISNLPPDIVSSGISTDFSSQESPESLLFIWLFCSHYLQTLFIFSAAGMLDHHSLCSAKLERQLPAQGGKEGNQEVAEE